MRTFKYVLVVLWPLLQKKVYHLQELLEYTSIHRGPVLLTVRSTTLSFGVGCWVPTRDDKILPYAHIAFRHTPVD